MREVFFGKMVLLLVRSKSRCFPTKCCQETADSKTRATLHGLPHRFIYKLGKKLAEWRTRIQGLRDDDWCSRVECSTLPIVEKIHLWRTRFDTHVFTSHNSIWLNLLEQHSSGRYMLYTRRGGGGWHGGRRKSFLHGAVVFVFWGNGKKWTWVRVL